MSESVYTTRLQSSFRAFLDDPRSFSNASTFLDTLHPENPCKPTNMGALPPEPANYTQFCTKDGAPAVFKFCAMLDRKGQYSKTDAYFNVASQSGDTSFNTVRLASSALGRLRVAIQARALSESDPMADFYPEGLIERSNAVIGTIAFLQQEFLDKINTNDNNITRCVRVVDVPDASEGDEDSRFDVVLTSHLLLPTLKRGAKSMPKITRADLVPGVPLSPSKLRSRGSANTSPATPAASSSRSSTRIPLRDLDDPNGIYAMCDDLLDTEVFAPRIFNGKGGLVHPNNYDKIPRTCPALIEATLCCIRFKPMGEDEKAITHLRLQSIHLLDRSLAQRETTPDVADSVDSATPTPKSKRKHVNDNSKAGSSKKRKTRSATSNASSSTAKDDDDEMAGVEEDD
ncbi:hypothetical protein DFP72DRAFT_1084361 [Ephemerocybe angulata]|uniref:Uncharacterized protein n=1 Tax=Ephemerocybe angulata TaxID=980116 RepID=A0A8H6H7H5_9AGAR|nr:hypothetical protein DFP72DRAFT_1084361 [Tulosesus angulatus]